jgi:GT2 family glycosyltransferase
LHRNKVAILVVNWKSSGLLVHCLECIGRQKCKPLDVLVLDNDSEDPIPERLQFRFPSVKFIKSETNIGFAAANNLLCQYASDCEWIATVNPDAFLEPDWLSKMLFAAETYPEYSFFASHLVKAANHEIIDGEGDAMHACGKAWQQGHGQSISRSALRPREVFSPCAAAAFYRRNALEMVGGFDEDFFCYFEDVELGFRLRLAGHRCLFVPDAVAYHVGSASTGGPHSDFAIYHGHRNLVWTYVKNMPGNLFWLLLPSHIVLNLITIIWFSIKGRGTIILKAKWDAILGVPRMWKKRRDIQKNRHVPICDIWRALNKRILPLLSQLLWKRCP